ncbi:hypothetical protein ACFFF6_19075, partial [Brachybacterium hainanense]
MTDQNSGRGRRRASGSRQRRVPPPAQTPPVHPDQHRAARDAAFGTTPRSWVDQQAEQDPQAAPPSWRPAAPGAPIEVPGRPAPPSGDEAPAPSPSAGAEDPVAPDTSQRRRFPAAAPPPAGTEEPRRPHGRRARALAPEERDAWAAAVGLPATPSPALPESPALLESPAVPGSAGS